MPAKDIYHDVVKTSLIKENWNVTHDPLRLSWGGKDMYVDFGAEKILAAEKNGRKIAIEVKSFVGMSEINETEKALGQYLLYRSVMSRTEPDRFLYLAVHDDVYSELFEEPLGQLLITDYHLNLLVFNIEQESITKWIP